MSTTTDLQAAVRTALDVESAHRNAQAKRYYELCDVRDAVYAKAQPLEDELAALNAEIEALQQRANAKAKEIEDTWGPDWLALKRSIRLLAAELGTPPNKIPPRDTLV